MYRRLYFWFRIHVLWCGPKWMAAELIWMTHMSYSKPRKKRWTKFRIPILNKTCVSHSKPNNTIGLTFIQNETDRPSYNNHFDLTTHQHIKYARWVYLLPESNAYNTNTFFCKKVFHQNIKKNSNYSFI